MKILFVADRINAKNDPNINLVKNMLPFMKKDNEVIFIGHDTDKNACNEFCFYFEADQKVRDLYFSLSGLSVFKKIAKLGLHPYLSFLGLLKKFNIDLIVLPYKRLIEKTVKKYSIDTVISISAPFYTAKAVSKADIKSKKIIYMFDPYAQHYIYKSSRTKKQEHNAISKADAVIVPKLLEKEYVCKYKNKASALEFPALMQQSIHGKSPYNSNFINLAFIGSLYSDIRNPSYLFRLLKALKINNFKLTVVGKMYGEYTSLFYSEFSEFIEKHVCFAGFLPKEEAVQYMLNADVLVNIGNLIENQLPSKIFDYLSTGKKILNITQISNCPTVSYLDKYENSLTVNSSEKIDEQLINKVTNFITESSDIEFAAVEKAFYECTPQYAAQQLINIVKG